MTIRNEPQREILATNPDTDEAAVPLPQYHNDTENHSVDDPLDEEEARRIQHWKDSPFAVGLVDVSWVDSRREGCPNQNASAYICPLLNAGRVGNMVVLKQSTEKQDEENIPRLDCVMGPYWLMTVCVTYPVILLISSITAVRIVNQPWPLILAWAILTMALLVALSMVACRNPGILRRFHSQPDAEWRWNDQARTFRPKGAIYDPECAVVIESFDHTCPWTGTAIGKRNMRAFRCFAILVMVCLVFDIFLITYPSVFG